MSGAPPGADLVALLPQRPPFLFVDAVDECDPGRAVRARYRLTGEEPFLAGHFPGNPIMPGVIELEALAQAGAIVILADPRFTARLPLFGGVERARFRRLVRPGDELVLAFTTDRIGTRGGWGTGRATVDGDICCEARLMFVFAPPAGQPT